MNKPSATILIASDRTGQFWVGFGDHFGPYADHGDAVAYAENHARELSAKGVTIAIKDQSGADHD